MTNGHAPDFGLGKLPLGVFLEQVASKAPSPGGGAVASVVGAIAASLGRMVIAYSVGKKSLEQHQGTLERGAALLTKTAEHLLELAEEDARAYTKLNELLKLPEHDERRTREFASAVDGAIAAPMGIVDACGDLLELLASLQPITNRYLKSDLVIAAILAQAGLRAGWWNVLVNMPLLTDPARKAALEQDGEIAIQKAHERAEWVERVSL